MRPDDAEALRRMFFRLSPETVYRRFFRPVRPPSDKDLAFLVNVDHDRREALVAELDGEIIAVARYDRLAGTDEAEIAVVVEDAWQGHGIGRRLVRRLAAVAQSRGVHVFTSSILGENRAAARLLRSVDEHPDVHIESGELLVRSTLVA